MPFTWLGLLALAWIIVELTHQPALGAVAVCLKFGWEDFRTARWLYNTDPQLWRRRSFILAFATARNIAMYTEARLGQLWQILTPLLNAGVYFLIFGLLLHVNRGIPNYLAFLVTGVFVFTFTQRAFISCSRVITDSLPLIRALGRK